MEEFKVIELPEELENRVQQAVSNFKLGFNCTQSVVGAFADLYGFTDEQAHRMAASFGGGIGRMRQTCGAACGLFMLVGLECGATDPKDREGKSHNYKIVQQLAERFKTSNGSIICGELLGLKKPDTNPEAAERTKEYYQKRPCVKMVESAARIFAQYYKEEHNQ